MVFCSAGGLRD